MYMKDMEQLLRMVERPQDYSDEEIMKLVSDPEMREYYELMVCAEAGFALKRSEEPKVSTRAKHYSLSSRFLKIAAVFIGVLLLSGIAFAAYRYVVGWGPSVEGELKSPTQEVRISNSPQQVHTEPENVRTFENAELSRYTPPQIRVSPDPSIVSGQAALLSSGVIVMGSVILNVPFPRTTVAPPDTPAFISLSFS